MMIFFSKVRLPYGCVREINFGQNMPHINCILNYVREQWNMVVKTFTVVPSHEPNTYIYTYLLEKLVGENY